MIIPDPTSPYVIFKLGPMDEVEGTILTPAQRARIQNLKMETVEQKLQLSPSALTQDGKETYWQQEAYLRGQLDILSYLITASDTLTQAEREQDSPQVNNPI